LLGIVVACAGLAAAPAAHAGLTLTPAFTGGAVSAPMYVTSPPGDSHRLFIVTRPGVIRVAVDGVLQSTPFLTIPNVWQSGEAGLISMAFDPDYENQASAQYGLFYVYYVVPPTGSQNGGDIHITEFHADPANTPNVANPTGRDVLVIPHPDNSNHYGGTLAFSPNDNLLYIGTGDGGGSDNQYGNAQNTKVSLLGKLLRIDPHQSGSQPYTIPSGNPFLSQAAHPCNPPSGATDCPEVIAWGLRNPFRWSFDRMTGDIAIADVGQGQEEEVDYVPYGAPLAGDDFGWPCKEGPLAYHTTDAGCVGSTFTDPVFAYSHSGLSGSVAITGGVVVRDPALTPLYGRYLYADFYAGIVHSLQLATPAATGDRVETDLPKLTQLVSFGQDADGHVYIVQLSGSVQRLGCDASCPAPPSAGGGSGGSPPGGQSPPPAQPAAQDTTAPTLRVHAAHLQDVLRRGLVRLQVRCSEACFTRATAKARGLALHGALAHLAAGKMHAFTLKASKRIRRALAHRGVVVVAIHARDAAGNLRTAHLTVRVRRG
jgi:glucose/arabinose dehydrogenase